jgi:hypothetical protein
MRGEMGELMAPVMCHAIGFGLVGMALKMQPEHAAGVLSALFFLIGIVSARYAIAMNVHVASHFANSVGAVWGTLQAWQNAMILVAPMIGSIVLDTMGPPWLFMFSAGAAGISFALFYGLRAMGMHRLHVPVVS